MKHRKTADNKPLTIGARYWCVCVDMPMKNGAWGRLIEVRATGSHPLSLMGPDNPFSVEPTEIWSTRKAAQKARKESGDA